MSNTPVIDGLMRVLADSYALALKTQNYHWNVEGKNFPALHALFETQYDEIFTAIDDVAERIRALGEKVPASLSHFDSMKTIKDGTPSLDEAAMVSDLYQSHQVLLGVIKAAMEASKKADDEGTTDLYVGRIRAHDKAAWMLNSITKTMS